MVWHAIKQEKRINYTTGKIDYMKGTDRREGTVGGAFA